MIRMRWAYILLAIAIILIVWINFMEQQKYDQITENLEKTPGQKQEEEEEEKETKDSLLSEMAVAADHPVAVDIGVAVLENGGNAVDAAVAVAYALSVLEPDASGLGGGGLMLVHPADEEEPVLYDYREVAPSSPADEDDAIGIPGFVKGMEQVHRDFGTIGIQELIEPSVVLAEEGIEVSQHLYERLKNAAYRMPVDELENFYPDGQPIQSGKLLKQQDLAETLRKIQTEGSSVFYTGSIGKKIEEELGISTKDMREYRVETPDPLSAEFAGYEVYAPSPPSGGLMMLQSLQLAERLELEKTKGHRAEFIHMVTEVIKRTYRSRLENIGDPAFEDVPVEKLLSSDYIEELGETIDEDDVTEEFLSRLDTEADREDNSDTTHFVVVDSDGMMVSSTNTLSNFFGTGEQVAGVFFNNQLDNYSSDEDSPNAREPGKRPHSYTTPMIFTEEGKPVMGIGAAGGRRIPATLLQVILKLHFYNENPKTALSDPRFFGQVNENEIYLEESESDDVEDELDDLGYNVEDSKSPTYFGAVQMLWVDYSHDIIRGAADPRRNGTWKVQPIDVSSTK